MGKMNNKVYKIVLTAVFAALSFAGLYIKIPLPTGGMVHLGNFVCVIASLLCGGLVGGIAGSVGMGFGDIFGGYSFDIVIRTIILKFLMGFVAGFVFRYILKRRYNPTRVLYELSGFFIIAFIFGVIIYSKGAITIGTSSYSKTISINVLVPIFLAIFAVSLFAAAIVSSRIKLQRKAVLLSTTLAVLVNILGEFVIRIFFSMIFQDVSFSVAALDSVAKLPASLITGFITVVFATLIFEAMFESLKSNEILKPLRELIDGSEEENEKLVDTSENK